MFSAHLLIEVAVHRANLGSRLAVISANPCTFGSWLMSTSSVGFGTLSALTNFNVKEAQQGEIFVIEGAVCADGQLPRPETFQRRVIWTSR